MSASVHASGPTDLVAPTSVLASCRRVPGATELAGAWSVVLMRQAMRPPSSQRAELALARLSLVARGPVPERGLDVACQWDWGQPVSVTRARGSRGGVTLGAMTAEWIARRPPTRSLSVPVPVLPPGREILSLVPDERYGQAVCDAVGSTDPVHLTASAARRAGYAAPLIPEIGLLLLLAQAAAVRPQDRIEACFFHYVPAGSAVGIWSHGVDAVGDTYSLRALGADRCAAILRVAAA